MMTFLIGLRVAADLSFYYAYAGFLASAVSGTALSLPGILFPSFLCALSRLAGERRPLRIAVLIPALLCFLLPGLRMGDRIALIPALLYAAYLAWSDNYSLSHDRQTDVFLLLGKSYPVFFLLMLLFGQYERLMAYSICPALLCAGLCVFLLRVLRHGTEVYRNPRLLLNNGLILVLILSAAWILHLKAVTDTLKIAVLAVYNGIIAPVLMAVLYGIAWVLSLIITPLLSMVTGEGTQMDLTSGMTGLEDQTTSAAGAGAPLLTLIVQILAAAALTAAVVALLIRLFRYLAGTREEEAASLLPSQELRQGAGESNGVSGEKSPRSPLHPVNRVRRHYRRYLQLCHQAGFDPHRFYTSREICEESTAFLSCPAEAAQLRAIYIRARYQGEATREDAELAGKLVDEMRSRMKGKNT